MRTEYAVVLDGAAVAAHQDEVVVGGLATTALSARLDHSFGQRREPPHVEGGELSPTGVGRERPSAAGAPDAANGPPSPFSQNP